MQKRLDDLATVRRGGVPSSGVHLRSPKRRCPQAIQDIASSRRRDRRRSAAAQTPTPGIDASPWSTAWPSVRQRRAPRSSPQPRPPAWPWRRRRSGLRRCPRLASRGPISERKKGEGHPAERRNVHEGVQAHDLVGRQTAGIDPSRPASYPSASSLSRRPCLLHDRVGQACYQPKQNSVWLTNG